MKKQGIICAIALLGCACLSSCQETSEKTEKNLSYKIENHEALTPDEYSTIIDYVGEYAEKAQPFVDMQINGTNLEEASAGMTKLNEEYPFVTEFRNCIRFTPSSALSSENLEKVAKYAGYIEFSAPSGYTLQTDSETAGLEEATPDTDNGVVAGAVDNVKEEMKNDW